MTRILNSTKSENIKKAFDHAIMRIRMSYRSGQHRLVVRVDGDNSIGTGHVIRMLALADMLRKDFSILFVMQNREPSLIAVVEKEGYSVHTLPVSSQFPAEAESLRHILRADDVLVLDGYFFDEVYQRLLLEHCAKIVCVDDINSYHFVAHAVINHAESATTETYSAEPYTKLCLGSKYALLRKEFFECRSLTLQTTQNLNDDRLAKSLSVLVCLGGADKQNHALKVAEALSEGDRDIVFNVVVGPANFNAASLMNWTEKQVEPRHALKIHQNVSAAGMVALLKSSDIVFCSASSIAIEAFAINVPVVCGVTADNQRKFASIIESKGVGKCIGDLRECAVEQLSKGFWSLVHSDEERCLQKQRQREMIDLESRNRIRNLFLELI